MAFLPRKEEYVPAKCAGCGATYGYVQKGYRALLVFCTSCAHRMGW